MEKAEAFAAFVENREVFTLLKPYLEGPYDVFVGQLTGVDGKYYKCIIKKVSETRTGKDWDWEVVEMGSSMIEAVERAVRDASFNVDLHAPSPK